MERRKCEFFLVRYVPDTLKNEFINIGVVLREADGSSRPLVRFTRDWGRVRCLDPDADVGMLEALEEELRARIAEETADTAAGVRPVLSVVEDSFSNTLQITNWRGCLAESLIAELENLMRVYVEPRKRQAPARKSGRAGIQATMRTQFERARVWSLMNKRIAASRYTQPGDQLRIDCGYRPNGVVRMFHAVSLESDSELAKVLAFSAPQLRDGVARVERAILELTAVVEPLAQVRSSEGDEEGEAQYRFAIETMEAQAIRVMTTSDLPRMAETAQRELRME